MAKSKFMKVVAESEVKAQAARDKPIVAKAFEKPQKGMKSEKPKTVRSIYSLTPERLEALKIYAIKHHMSMTKVIELGLEKLGVFDGE